MPRTPDRKSGDRDETAITFENTTPTTTTVEGELRYSGTQFRMRDAAGEFDPRVGGGISEAGHEALRQLIHFIDSGPASGFASGAYYEVSPAGPFPTSYIWYESAAKSQKIVELTVTRGAGQQPTSEVWEMYAEDGTTILATITDAIAYSGAFEASRTRTIA